MATLKQARQSFSIAPAPDYPPTPLVDEVTKRLQAPIESDKTIRRRKLAEMPATFLASRSDSLQGLRIAFTGKLSRFRNVFKAVVRHNGGGVHERISVFTTHLVSGEGHLDSSIGPVQTAKIHKAKEYGIPIIDEEAFILMVQTR
jgi:BRCT domain type II-containing protein